MIYTSIIRFHLWGREHLPTTCTVSVQFELGALSTVFVCTILLPSLSKLCKQIPVLIIHGCLVLLDNNCENATLNPMDATHTYVSPHHHTQHALLPSIVRTMQRKRFV